MANMALPLGAPRAPRPRFQRPVRSDIVIPIVAPFQDSPVQAARVSEDPTVHTRRRNKTTLRIGAEAPASSALTYLVLIAIAVGLLAFATMTFCVHEPSAHAASVATPAATTPAAAPTVAPATITAEVATPEPTTTEPTAKPAHTHRRASKSKKSTLPTNPYLASAAL